MSMLYLTRQTGKGFTLLEILIVIAISSTLLMLVVPNLYRSIAATDLPNATRELATALRKSQSQSISTFQQTSLILNVEERRYRLSFKDGQFQLPKELDLTLLTGAKLLQGVPGEEGAIFFYPDGSSSGGRITLQRGKRKQQIDINWLTGESHYSR